mgnify:CR=1 FL=1
MFDYVANAPPPLPCLACPIFSFCFWSGRRASVPSAEIFAALLTVTFYFQIRIAKSNNRRSAIITAANSKFLSRAGCSPRLISSSVAARVLDNPVWYECKCSEHGYISSSSAVNVLTQLSASSICGTFPVLSRLVESAAACLKLPTSAGTNV